MTGAGPSPAPPAAVAVAEPDLPRPFALTASAVMTVTAGLQVATLVGFVWLVMYAGAAAFSYDVPQEAAVYHLLSRGSLVMAQGLWVPLIGLPLAAFVLGFLLLIRTDWPRVVLTLLGLGAVAWMVWWRSDALEWVSIPAGYVLFCTILLWTPAVTRWIRTRPRPPEAAR